MGVALPKIAADYGDGFNGGVGIRGLPLHVVHPGEVFWVDENASHTGRGTFKNPDTSIDTAIGRCVANRGDIIMVKPNHVDNVSAAAGIVMDIAGVAIVGLGRGDSQAEILFDTADTADVDVSAADCAVINMALRCNFANVDGAFDLAATADSFLMQGCLIEDAGTNAKDFEEFINVAIGCNDFQFIGNTVRSLTGGDTESLVFTAGTCYDFTVIGNNIIMPATAAIFDIDDDAITGVPLFKDNLMINLDTTTGLSVAIAAGTVGVFIDERYGSAKANTVPASDLSASYIIGALGTDAVAVEGVAWPATSAAWS